MNQFSRRTALKLMAAGSILLTDDDQDNDPPKYIAKDSMSQFHCTTGYPERWKQVYKNTLDHFSERWGKVGPSHIFLIENEDWPESKPSPEKVAALEDSQTELKRTFCTLHGQDSDGEHLDWKTGNHWTSWSLKPANLVITMTMSPSHDGEQFVVGPIHEYMHAIQIVFGYAKEAIAGNQMGHALWTGPAWFREGSAVIVASLYSYLHPELFKKLEHPYSWRTFSSQMNRSLDLYQKARTPLREGVTHNDWQTLEPKKLVYPVVYCGGSIACALLLKKTGSLEGFMDFFPLVPTLGWQTAFEKHFGLTLAAFYKEFEAATSSATVKSDKNSHTADWCEFLKSIQESPTSGVK